MAEYECELERACQQFSFKNCSLVEPVVPSEIVIYRHLAVPP